MGKLFHGPGLFEVYQIGSLMKISRYEIFVGELRVSFHDISREALNLEMVVSPLVHLKQMWTVANVSESLHWPR